MIYFMILSEYLLGGNEGNHEHVRWMVNGYHHTMVTFLHLEKISRLLNSAEAKIQTGCLLNTSAVLPLKQSAWFCGETYVPVTNEILADQPNTSHQISVYFSFFSFEQRFSFILEN